MERAACWSLAVARMATPVRVSLKIRMKIRVPTAAKIKPHRRPDGTMAIPRSNGSAGNISGKERKSGDQIRLTAQLINVEDGFHIWSKVYDNEATDIFAIQDEIASAVAGALAKPVEKKSINVDIRLGLGAVMAVEHAGFTLDDLQGVLAPQLEGLTPATFAVTTDMCAEARSGYLPPGK